MTPQIKIKNRILELEQKNKQSVGASSIIASQFQASEEEEEKHGSAMFTDA